MWSTIHKIQLFGEKVFQKTHSPSPVGDEKAKGIECDIRVKNWVFGNFEKLPS